MQCWFSSPHTSRAAPTQAASEHGGSVVVLGWHSMRHERTWRLRHFLAFLSEPEVQMMAAARLQAVSEHGTGAVVVVTPVVVVMPHRLKQRSTYVERHGAAVGATPHNLKE